MEMHPLFENFFLSGTLVPVQNVELTFDEWMRDRVWSVMPLRVTELAPAMLHLYVLLRDEGFSIDRITGCFSPPGSKKVYRGFSDDINCIVFVLCYCPIVYIPALFTSTDTE